MELDDMKQVWQQYNNVLAQNQTLNEKLVTHLLKDRSKNAINRLLNIEYLGVAVAALILLFLLINHTSMSASIPLGICYGASLAFIIVSLLFSAYKIRHLGSIDLNIGTVTDTATRMERFRLLIIYERMVTIAATPFLIAALFAVMMQFVHGVDIFEDIYSSLLRIFLGFSVAIIAMLIMYKRLYFHTIKQVTDNLKEIEEFKKE